MTDDFSHLPPVIAQVCRAANRLDKAFDQFAKEVNVADSCIQAATIREWNEAPIELRQALAAARQPRPGDMETAQHLTMPFRDDVIRSPERMKTLQEGIAAALAGERAKCVHVADEEETYWNIVARDRRIAGRDDNFACACASEASRIAGKLRALSKEGTS